MRKFTNLFFTLFIFLHATPLSAQQKYAVVVGINQYYDKPGVPHPNPLKGCVNDALAIKNVLMRRFGFAEKNIQTLLNAHATKQTVQDALLSMLDKCKAGDAVVFYYSGHGSWMTNGQQNMQEFAFKGGMDQAMVMSDLYTAKLGCLFSDALVKKIFDRFVQKKVIPTLIFDCCFSGKLPMAGAPPEITYIQKPGGQLVPRISNYDLSESDALVSKFMDNYEFMEAQKSDTTASGDEKSFNLKDPLHVDDPEWIPRPSEIAHSMFLSLSATSDTQPGLDITDETGNKHGAYTKALLDAIYSNPANTPVSTLIRKAAEEIKFQQYPQDPEHHQDDERLSKNLIGISPENFSNDITARCSKISGNRVILDAGFLDGISAGNVLQYGNGKNKIVLRVIGSEDNKSTATILTGKSSALHQGDLFMVTGRGITTHPILKLFVRGTAISSDSLNRFITLKCAGLSKLANFSDYNGWDPYNSLNLYFNTAAKQARTSAESLLKGKSKESFLVFLPVPNYITGPLINLLKKNRNIRLVDNADSADLVLYLNYVGGGKPVFTWNNFHGKLRSGSLQFSRINIPLPAAKMDSRANKQLVLDIQNLLIPTIRAHSDRWLHDWPVQ